MKALTLSLTTFLKINAYKARSKIRELRTFTEPGGYDFYKVMKRLASELASRAIDLAEAKRQIKQIKQAPERNHTLEAITRFYAWLVTQPDFQWKAPPKGLFVSKSGLLKIRVVPEVGYLGGAGKPIALQIWNLNSPEMKSVLAAEGVRLLVDTLPATFSCGLFDLRKQYIHTEAAITGASDVQLARDLQIVETIWTDLHNASLGTDDMVEHIAALSAP